LRADGLSIHVSLAAPPVDGAANEELLSLLAVTLSLPKGALSIALGGQSRNKVVRATGLAKTEIVARLARAAAAG
jgi:uncharacterized protein YggU (UPF0235/DUF167 family)